MIKKLLSCLFGLALTASIISANVVHAVSVNDLYIVPKSSVHAPGKIWTDIYISKKSSTGGINFSGLRNTGSSSVLPGYENAESLKKIYNIPLNLKGGDAIAILDFYYDPTSLHDFNYYSQVGGYPIETSTDPLASSNKVLQVVYADGTQPDLDPNRPLGWDLETSLDIEIAHATAPNAKIYLVETSTLTSVGIEHAIKVASTLPGVKEVSMSWGTDEGNVSYEAWNLIFDTPGVTFFASAGDSGDGVAQYPSGSADVIAVGGTTIERYLGNFKTEQCWPFGGGGPSIYEQRPGYQSKIPISLPYIPGVTRLTPDISADADPSTGVAVYDTNALPYSWYDVGGTSLSAPFIAGLANIAGSQFALSKKLNTLIYNSVGTGRLRDIVLGFNGGGYEPGPSYDLATGVGVPNGLGVFVKHK